MFGSDKDKAKYGGKHHEQAGRPSKTRKDQRGAGGFSVIGKAGWRMLARWRKDQGFDGNR